IVGGNYRNTAVVVKLTPTGARIWSKVVVPTNAFYDGIVTMNIAPNDETLLCANNTGGARFVKLNSGGTVSWDLPADDAEMYRDSHMLPNGNWLVMRPLQGLGLNGAGVRAIALLPSGAVAWSRTLFFTSPSHLGNQEGQQFDTCMDAYGDTYFTLNEGLEPGAERFRSGKLTASGSFRWSHQFDFPTSFDAVSEIAIRRDTGDIFAFGSFAGANDSFRGVCYKQSVGANQETYTIPRNLVFNSPKSVFWNDRYTGEATASIAINPLHGTVTMSPTGFFTYSPQAGYFGPDSFTYRATKSGVDASLAVVNITVL
ncbi:MAG: Ig-like domain-containing protein, partial [Fimbriimonadaceae bacterium]